MFSRAVDEDWIDFAGPLILVLLLSPGVLKVGVPVGAGLTGCAAAVGGGGVFLEAAAVPRPVAVLVAATLVFTATEDGGAASDGTAAGTGRASMDILVVVPARAGADGTGSAGPPAEPPISDE